MRVYANMTRVVTGLIVCVSLSLGLARPAYAADATLFRLFLLDGSVLVSYGEFARVDDKVIFSMPVGGRTDEPRLQVASVRAALIDWPRTDRYSASARFQRYAQTRGEEDFRVLSNEVALALNDVALSGNRQQALALAEKVRKNVADWPTAHFGYRSNDVREIVSVLDEAITSLRSSTGGAAFEFSLVATAEAPPLEPVLGLPTPRQQFDQIMHLAELSTSSDRVALLQAAMTLVSGAAATIDAKEADPLRRTVEKELRQELAVDRQYSALSQKFVTQATAFASRAAIADIERLVARIPKEDAKLGQKRPEIIESMNGAVQTQLFAARRLRLLRDQWLLRQASYRSYQRSVASQILLLVKSQPMLDSIRRLDGPPPDRLLELRGKLSGGAERLERIRTPDYLRGVHDLLVGTWRFADNATRARVKAIEGGDPAAAWEASSAAAGALMMLTRVQSEIRDLLEPPRLQHVLHERPDARFLPAPAAAHLLRAPAGGARRPGAD